ncbi:hypothetical protein EVG20_g10271 [Dentipellis fragilis]|uniref:BTB domain-containing protein n=1 Tax=Dentipellis fragilis TaxID=205917 RepID=A0A4Y9XSR0_9AGAM|nr:hypothetical protein EVG20_g10271 [Dentipellis fragilis]
MLSDPREALQYADAPFDGSDGDIILRSSDKVHFVAFKNILSIASPMFCGMFTLPQGVTPDSIEPSSRRQIVQLSEDARAIDIMLRACYPKRRPKITGMEDARIVLELSRKYQMEVLQEIAEDMLTAIIPSNPVSVYALASHYDLTDLAARAATFTNFLESLYSDDLHLLDGKQFYLLVHYRQRCSEAAISTTANWTWITTFPTAMFQQAAMQLPSPCNCFPADSSRTKIISRAGTAYRATHWWWRYIEQTKGALKDMPSGHVVSDPTFLKATLDEARACCNCKTRMDGNQDALRNFAQVFAEEVDKAVVQVSVKFLLNGHFVVTVASLS